jgi:hypothetical protein
MGHRREKQTRLLSIRDLSTQRRNSKNIVWWFNNVFGWEAEFKPELLK